MMSSNFNFNFTNLPAELRVICAENLIDSWSLSIRGITVNGQPSWKLHSPPQGLQVMAVSKEFQNNIKAALVKKFDKKLELCLGSHIHFMKLRQHHKLQWLTNKIEGLTMHIRGPIPAIDYHFKFLALKRIDLIITIASAPRGQSPRTVFDVLVNRTMDAQVLNTAATLARKIKGNNTSLRRILQEKTLDINAIWYCNTYHGSMPTMGPGDKVIITTDLMTINPTITDIKAQLEGCIARKVDANGNVRYVYHFLRLI